MHHTTKVMCEDMDHRYHKVAEEQDAIGWRQIMEGMLCAVSENCRKCTQWLKVCTSQDISGQWTVGVIIKLLETTHGQWLYRCIEVHDRVRGTQVMLVKEELQREIEAQQDLGWVHLLEEDQYLVEVNLENLENTLGKRQEYWLIAM
jgi:hypothetical protein